MAVGNTIEKKKKKGMSSKMEAERDDLLQFMSGSGVAKTMNWKRS